MRKPRVLAAMSGGVDSAVAAAFLKNDDYDVIGITMQIWPAAAAEEEGFGGCCSVETVTDAKKVAFKLGIRHYVLNFRKAFERTVIDDFCREYLAGRTPNPCVRCNQHVKFELLLQKATELGADFIATGHYARIVEKDGVFSLLKGVDARKDQSYVLYMMGQDHLRSTLMPLGTLTKAAVREIAKKLELSIADKEESQEICFVPHNNYGRFLTEYLGISTMPGPILDVAGNEIGRHKGLIYYTVGQRRRLGIAAREPLYVMAIDTERNAVVAGTAEQGCRTEFIVEDVAYVEKPIAVATMLKTKIRYKSQETLARVSPLGEKRLLVSLSTPQKAVAPGQAAVFYRGEAVVGGGTIS